MRPENLAVLTVEAVEQTLHAVGVNLVGGGVANDVRPTDAGTDDGSVEDVEAFFPHQIAGVGVEGHDTFLLLNPLAGVVNEVDESVHDNRRGAAAVIGFPNQIARGVIGLEGELVGQPCLRGDAVLVRPAPTGPISRLGLSAGQDEPCRKQDGDDAFHNIHSR